MAASATVIVPDAASLQAAPPLNPSHVATTIPTAPPLRIYPRGGIVMVNTRAVTLSRRTETFHRFMLDQDTGGAIRAPGRADIFMGTGDRAEVLAGGQYAEGTLFYFFLKPEYVPRYRPAAR